MLSITLDEVNGIALFEPEGALTVEDFQSATKTIDAWLEKNDKLTGLVIHAKLFPGWESFAALASHLTFVKDHHRKITHLALVTDSKVGFFVDHMAKHFVKAEIKLFSGEKLEEAKDWAIEAG